MQKPVTNPEIIQQVIAAQELQLASPAKAVVNSESMFVRQRLIDQGFAETARIYWCFACGVGYFTDNRVLELQAKLRQIDQASKAPSWICSGT